MITLVLAQKNIFDTPMNPPPNELRTLGGILSALLPNLYILAGIIFMVLLIAGGIGMITSAGSGMKEGVAKGQKMITAVVIGFIVVIGSYWIIQIISTVTGLNILEPGI